MKKMVLKNWFWLVILLVTGIKYGTAQETKWDNAHPNPAKTYIENKKQEKKFNEFKKSIGLTPVKKYDLPVIVKETDNYIVQNVKDLQYKIILKNNNTYGLRTGEEYYIDYQDYQDIIEFFQQLVVSKPTAINYRYEAEGDNWSISVIKADDLKYGGRLSNKSLRTDSYHHTYLEFKDVMFLASLPIDIWE